MADAYPMIEQCVKYQQKYVPYITEQTEPTYINGMLLLDNGERKTAIMCIKFVTDEALEDFKIKADSRTDVEITPDGVERGNSA